jgi:hypothetical protein
LKRVTTTPEETMQELMKGVVLSEKIRLNPNPCRLIPRTRSLGHASLSYAHPMTNTAPDLTIPRPNLLASPDA